MARSRRVLVRHEGALWRLASVRSTSANVVLSMSWCPPALQQVLKLENVHLTVSRATGHVHETYVLIDGSRLALYPDGLRLTNGSGFGHALELLSSQGDFLEHRAQMLSPVPSGANYYVQLFSGAQPAAWSDQMGYEPVTRRDADAVIEWGDVGLSFGVRPCGSSAPIGSGDLIELTEPFDDRREAALTLWPLGQTVRSFG